MIPRPPCPDDRRARRHEAIVVAEFEHLDPVGNVERVAIQRGPEREDCVHVQTSHGRAYAVDQRRLVRHDRGGTSAAPLPRAAKAAATSGRPTPQCVTPNASSRCKPNAPMSAPSLTGQPQQRWARARDRDAHLKAWRSSHRARPAPGSERRAMRASLGGRRVVLDAAEA